MNKKAKALPRIVSPKEWQAAHEKLLAKEKAATRARDALAATRRRQPMVEIEKDYLFEGPDGWLGNFRRLTVRWDRLMVTYGGFFHLACALLVLRRVVK